MIKYNEFFIQNVLYNYLFSSNCKHVIPNVYYYRWESDMLSIRQSGYVVEYEIKINKYDFKKDINKDDKHNILKYGWRLPNKSENWLKLREEDEIIKTKRPNYFFYVCPINIIDVKDVSEYAGLIYINGQHIEKIKEAPRLHKTKADNTIYEKFSTAYRYKYWELRRKKLCL